jgi:hypothetical protein
VLGLGEAGRCPYRPGFGRAPAKVDGDLRVQRRPVAGRAVERHGSAKCLDSIFEADDPGSTGICASDAVIANGDREDAVPTVCGQIDGRRLRVLDGICARLGNDVIGGRLEGPGKPSIEMQVEFERDRKATGERRESRLEARLGEDRGVDSCLL